MSRSDHNGQRVPLYSFMEDTGPHVPSRGLPRSGKKPSLGKVLARMVSLKRQTRPPAPPESYRRY